MGKVLLLIEVARQIAAGEVSGTTLVDRPKPVGDSGLWQHLSAPALTIADLCTLVGAVSDNLATNALIEFVGLPAVARMARTHLSDLPSLALCDVVRDARGPDHAPELSLGSTHDWSALMHRLANDELIDVTACAHVRGWLSLNVDHSMVLAPFAIDPLSINPKGTFNKTGWDAHVRADAGSVMAHGDRHSYSACVSPVTHPGEALHRMQELGDRLRNP